MTKFEQWCESEGYTVDSGIHTHLLSAWADEFAESEVRRMFDLLAAKLQTESKRAATLAINFDGHSWQVGDMYGYGVPEYDGKDLDSLFRFIKEDS